jgi:hypothetical protein
MERDEKSVPLVPEQPIGKKLNASIDSGSAKTSSYREVAAWSVAGNVARLTSVVLIGGVGLEFARLYSMQNSQSYTADQWNSVVQTRGVLVEVLWACMLLCIALVARQFLSALPLVPTIQNTRNPMAMPVPMTWPPVPEGSPSPLRRISVQLSVTAPVMWALCWIATVQLDGNLQPSTTKYVILVSLCALGVLGGLLSIVMDVLRLRGWANWPQQTAAPNYQSQTGQPV